MPKRTDGLIVALGLCVLAWTAVAIHSPLSGWAGRLWKRGVSAAYRLTASPLCSDCALTTHLVNGVELSHPDTLETVFDDALNSRVYTYSTMDRWQRCGLSFTVMALSPDKVGVLRNSYLKGQTVLSERRMNGWQVVFLASRQPSTQSAALFGANRIVTIDTIIDERIVDTPLSRWVEREFRETIARLCAHNDSGAANAARAGG